MGCKKLCLPTFDVFALLLPLLLPSLSCRLRRDGARTGEAAHVADSLHLATEKGGDFSFFWWKIGTWASTMIWKYLELLAQKTLQKRFHQLHEQLVFSHGTSGLSSKIGLQLQFSYTV